MKNGYAKTKRVIEMTFEEYFQKHYGEDDYPDFGKQSLKLAWEAGYKEGTEEYATAPVFKECPTCHGDQYLQPCPICKEE